MMHILVAAVFARKQHDIEARRTILALAGTTHYNAMPSKALRRLRVIFIAIAQTRQASKTQWKRGRP